MKTLLHPDNCTHSDADFIKAREDQHHPIPIHEMVGIHNSMICPKPKADIPVLLWQQVSSPSPHPAVTDTLFQKGRHLGGTKGAQTCLQANIFKPSVTQVVVVGWFFKSQQHAIVSQRRICSDNFTCCHTETEVADQAVYLTQSQYTDTRSTSPSADPTVPGAWQCSHWSANF